MIGKTVGKYKIEKKLGQGGMGTVYKGQDQVLGRPVAIKVLSEAASQNQEMIQRFSIEARAAARLEHPNIVQVYDFFKAENQYFLVLQYVDGQSLADLIKKRGPLPVPMSIKIMIPSLMALHKAHSQGIVHRDIKPDNIMISKEGVVKVADFGIAKLKNEATKLTVTGQIMGTPHYMSPEQCMGESSIDRRSDIYSMGVTFYYMLAGSPPFDAESALVILNMQVGKPLPDLLEKRSDVPPALWAVILKITAKVPRIAFRPPGRLSRLSGTPKSFRGVPALFR